MNIDMICDKCIDSLPIDNYIETKTVEAISEDNTSVNITGGMPKDTNAAITNIQKDNAFELAQNYMDVAKEDIVQAYDISLNSDLIKYQPSDYNKSVKVELSNLELEEDKKYAMLHIIDDKKYEIIPVEKLSNNKISFNATSFSTYILIRVEGHMVTFTGENYKVYDLQSNEITNDTIIASGTNFMFYVRPNDGWGLTDITCVNAAATSVAIETSGYIEMKNVKIASVTEDLIIDVTTVIAPAVTVQPVSVKAQIGGTATYTIAAENATTYQWQYRDKGNTWWTDVSTSQTLNVTVAAAMAGRQYRCLVGNDNFINHERVPSDIAYIIPTDDEITEQAIVSNISNDSTFLPPIITVQPVTIKAKVGSTANFTISADNATNYQWQYRDSKEEYWTNATKTNSTSGTATLSVTAAFGISGREYRCLVGNANYIDHGRIKSDLFRIVVAEDEITEPVTVWDLEITKQPESQKIKFGDTATFSVETAGTNTYKWQYKTSNASGDWLDVDANLGTSYAVASDFTTNTLKIDTSNMTLNEDTLEVANSLSNYVFRCVVNSTIYAPAQKTSDSAFLSVAQDDIVIDNIQLKKQPTINVPETITVGPNETKTYDIAYDGDGAITFISGDATYATTTLEGNTLTVTGVAEGSTSITIEASSGTEYAGKTVTINIKVVDTSKLLITEWTIPVDADKTLATDGVAKTTITLPIPSNATNAYTVDWGDGTTNTYDNTADLPTHIYTNTEETVYTISVKGKVDKFGYNDDSLYSGSPYYTFTSYVTGLKQWGELEAKQYGFSYCKNLSGVIPSPTVNSFTNLTSCENLFLSCSKLTGPIPEGIFDNANNVTSFKSVFSHCSGLRGNIHEKLFANTKVVTDFSGAFNWCSGLEGEISPNLFVNTPLVTDFTGTFISCSGLTGGIPKELFAKTPLVTSFKDTFSGCSKLTGEISPELFKNTPLVTDFSYTFSGCSDLTGELSPDLFKENPQVTTFSAIFLNCESLSGEIPSKLFEKNLLVTDFSRTFENCKGLIGNIPEELFKYTDKVEDFSETFYLCTGLRGNIPEKLFLNTPLVTSFSSTFASCTGLTGEIPADLFTYTPLVTSFSSTFKSCRGLTGNIPAKLFAETRQVTSFTETFCSCPGLTGAIPENLFETTPNVKSFHETFYRCEGITSVPVGLFDNNIGITSNTSKSSGYAETFYGCSGLTSAVIDSKYVGYNMFYGCNKLTDITITDNVKSIYGANSFEASSYSSTNLLPTTLITANPVALSYDWAADYRGVTVIDPTAFITEWTIPVDADKTLETEGVAKTTITLPIPSNATNAYTVDWGDGTTNTYDNTADFPTHTYENTEETVYTISIKGKVYSFGYYSINNVTSTGTYANYYTFTQYLTGLIQWGELGATRYGFSRCINLASTIPSPTENSFANITSCEYLFFSCLKLTGSIPKNLFVNASNVTSFYSTFRSCTGLTGNIPGELFKDASNVTSFYSTFSSCTGLTGNIPGGLFTENVLVESFNSTFYNCTGLTGNIPEGLFTENVLVENFNSTFEGCVGLAGAIPENLFATTQNVTFEETFYECRNLTSIPGLLFANTPNVTTFYSTFERCTGLTCSIPGNLFEKTEKVKNFQSTFSRCKGLTGEIPGELFKNTKEVTDFSFTFRECSNLTDSIPGELFENTQLVKSFYQTFYKCNNLAGDIPATLFANTKVVESNGFEYTFYGCSKLTSIPKELFANTPLVISFQSIFESCSGITNIPKELFANTTAARSFYGAFRGCINITEVPEGLFENIESANYTETFYGCSGLTSAVIDSNTVGNKMFSSCNNLTNITITDRVQSIYGTGSFHATPPYSSTNLLPTTLTTTNPVALSYNWVADNRSLTINNSASFTTEWTIPAGGATVTLPVPQADNNNYVVTWGDGTSTTVDNTVAFPTHTYTNTAETVYEIAITGTANSFGYFEANAPASNSDYHTFTQYLTSVKQWGEFNCARYGFSNCTKLNSVSKEVASTTFSNVTSMDYMFNNCTALTELNLTKWNTSTVTSMNSMFNGCTGLVRLDLSNINTLATTSMNSMFANCNTLKSILLGSDFDKITGSGMFNGCTSLQSIITQRGNAGASITEIEVGEYIEYTPPKQSTPIIIDGEEVTLETEDAKWRVVEIDGTNEKILLAAEGVVNAGQITLNGIEGYTYGPDLLDDICAALYSDTELGVEARSMTVEDLNRICGYTVTANENKVVYYPTGTSVSGIDSDGYKRVAHSWGAASFYDYDKGGVDRTDAKGYPYRTPTSSNPVYVTASYYTYNPVEKNSALEGILGTEVGWLASRCVNNFEDNVAYFGIYYLSETLLDAPGLIGSHGLDGAMSFGLRPVISIDVGDLVSAMSEGELTVENEEETEIEVVADEPLEVGIKTLELATDTGLEDLTDAILYVPNLTSEEKYEDEANYETVFGAKDASGDIFRVRPILEVVGENPITVSQNSVYDAEKDEGATIAGFGEAESGEYLYYNYSLIESGLPVDTTIEREREVTYTTKYTDYTPVSGDAATIMTVMSATRNINVVNTDKYFITEWTIPVDLDGTLSTEGIAKTTIQLPIPSNAVNSYTVDWGDGTSNTYDSTANFPTHTYENTEERKYEISISGIVNSFGYSNTYEVPSTSEYYSATQYITGLKQWGEVQMVRYGFAHCRNLAGTIPSPTVNSFVNVKDFSRLFSNCSNLIGPIPVDLFKYTSNVAGAEALFNNCRKLSGEIPEELFKNFTETKSFYFTFYGCEKLSGSIPGKLFEKTTQVTTFENTFTSCSGLSGEIPAGLFATTEGVKSFKGTFAICRELSGNIPAGLFANTKLVTTFENTFGNCNKLTGNIPTDLFKFTENVVSFRSTFNGCSGLSGEVPSTLFANTKNVTSFYRTFDGCIELTSVPAGLFASNIAITDNTSTTAGYAETFSGCSLITSAIVDSKYVGYRMFYNCKKLVDITITDDVQEIYSPESFKVLSPYSPTNLLPTNLTTTNEDALAYDWVSDNRSVEKDAPVVSFSPNGNTVWANSQSTTITVTDDGVGVDANSLKYMWTQTLEAPAEDSFTTSFTNGQDITKDTVNGNDWYLWVIAKDIGGNTIITNSNAFYLDNTKPEVTVTSNGTAYGSTVTLSITDTYSGVIGWQVVEANASLGEWNNIESVMSTNIDYRPSKNGVYTVVVIDEAGNISENVEFEVILENMPAPIISAKLNNYNGEEYSGDYTNQLVLITLTNNNADSVYKYEWSTSSGDGFTSANLFTTGDGIGKMMFNTEMKETIYFRAIDDYGNYSEVSHIEIKIDKTSPLGSIYIRPVYVNGETKYTNTHNVIIDVAASDNYSEDTNLSIALVNAEDFDISDPTNNVTWMNYEEQKSWQITNVEGLRKVHIIIKDEAGNLSLYKASEN